mmetsp:Transcript_33908/g.56032  ORF Transcript_33908/g.56032 Transcript_33908/m.56032 type:complete len:289 (+) Transcript_33908:166-1032(+)
MKLAEEVFASAASGCVSTVIGHPLDCLKVRMQTDQRRLSTFNHVMAMIHHDGIRAFTRGIAAPLANAVLMNTVMFVAFAEARKRLPNDGSGALLAGALSGVVQATFSTPMDWLKIQAQLHGGSSYTRLIEALRQPSLGMRIIYTGHTMNLLREAVFTAIYLGMYSHIRLLVASSSAMPVAKGKTGASDNGSSGGLALVGLTSASTGALAWLACFPFDSVKSVQQAALPNTLSAKLSPLAVCRSLVTSGGLGVLYRGVGSSTARAILVTCSRLVAYESVMHFVGGDSSL